MLQKHLLSLMIFFVLASAPIHTMQAHETSATKAAGDHIDVWLRAISSNETTKSKTRQFFNYLGKETSSKFIVQTSTNVDEVISGCSSGKPEIVFLTSTFAQRIIDQCNYTAIAQTRQSIGLYVRNTSSIDSVMNVRSVALIENVSAYAIAVEELHLQNHRIKSFHYINYFEILKKTQSDNIDSMIASNLIIKASPLFLRKWRPIFWFKSEGNGMLLVSPKIDEELKNKITAVLKRNDQITKDVWQDTIGVGPFTFPPFK